MTNTINILFSDKTWKPFVVDAFVLASVYFMPILAHSFEIPVYLFEPMRMALFMSIFFLNSRNNAYFLALCLPLFSFIVTGHPVVIKNIIMAMELLVNVYVLFKFLDLKINPFACSLMSIVISKSIYYALKYIAVGFGFMNTAIIGTSVVIQVMVALVLSVLFWLAFRRKNNHIF